MARQSEAQKDTMQRVMHAFEEGELKTSRGTAVKSRKQAVAIGLHEAGASNRETPQKNRQNRARTERRERSGEADDRSSSGAKNAPTKADLYARARKQGIEGRSKMSKAELEKAVQA